MIKDILTRQIHLPKLFKDSTKEIYYIEYALKLLLISCLSTVPLILQVHSRTIYSPLLTRVQLLGIGYKGDLFTYYKMLTLIYFALVGMLLLTRLVLLKKSIVHTKEGIITIFFIITILVSTTLSSSIQTALYGTFDRHDGALTFLSILILVLIATQLKFSVRIITVISYSLIPFVLLNFFIISMNHYGNDVLNYHLIQKTLSLAYTDYKFSEESFLLGTLNQWNFLSGIFSALVVFYISLMLIDHKSYMKFLYCILASMCLWITLLSLSTSGSLTILMLTPILVYIFLIMPKTKIQVITITLLFSLFVSTYLYLSSQNERVHIESLGMFERIDIESASLLTINEKLKNIFESENMESSNTYLPDLPEPSTSAGSGRVYIWIKTVELFLERPLFGYGLDTLMYNFPHYSIDARSGLSTEKVIVDKPHNMYLGVLYGTGIFGFIFFMALLIFFITKTIKSIKKGLIILYPPFIFVLAFMIQGFFNDTLPGTSVIFFLIIGILISISNGRL